MRPSARRRLLPAAMAAALVAGAGTAVLASGAGPAGGTITLKGSDPRVVKILGSDGEETVTLAGNLPGSLTIGNPGTITNLNADCEPDGVFTAPQAGFCGRKGLQTIDVRLAGGADELRFYKFAENNGVKLAGAGGPGSDAIDGTERADRLKGGDGPDQLRGFAARDSLDGGRATDECDGGGGRDRLENCE